MKLFSLPSTILLLLLCLSACNSHPVPDDENSSGFIAYLKTLDTIPLPLHYSPFQDLPDLSTRHDKELFKQFKYAWCTKPLGILYQNAGTVGILDCSLGDYGWVPFLTTYNMSGEKIDSTNFLDISGADFGYMAVEHVSFLKNRQITVLDTLKQWEIKPDGSDIIEESLKIKTSKTHYSILKNGKIKTQKSSSLFKQVLLDSTSQ